MQKFIFNFILPPSFFKLSLSLKKPNSKFFIDPFKFNGYKNINKKNEKLFRKNGGENGDKIK